MAQGQDGFLVGPWLTIPKPFKRAPCGIDQLESQ